MHYERTEKTYCSLTTYTDAHMQIICIKLQQKCFAIAPAKCHLQQRSFSRFALVHSQKPQW